MKINYSLLFILLLAAALRLINLNQSFWLDEAAQALESLRPLNQQLDIIPDFQPPLYHLIVHFMTYFGRAEWWLRLASVIPALMTVFFTYRLNRLLKNEFAASLAGLLLATSQFHVYYSQELRPYALAAMLAVWSMSELFLIIKHQKSSFILFTLINVAGLYTMYLYPLFMLTQLFIIAFSYRHLFKPIVLCTLFSALCFVPWLPTFWLQLQAGTGLLNSLPGWGNTVSPNLMKMLPLTLVKLSYGHIRLDYNFETIFSLIILGITVLWSLKQAKLNQSFKTLFIWLLLPILLSFLISLKIPILEPKRVMFVLPALYILLSLGLNRQFKSLFVILILLTLNMLNLSRYYLNLTEQREPWKPLINSLSPLTGPDVVVFFAFPEPFAPWLWYADPAIPTLAFVPKDLSDPEIISRISNLESRNSIISFDYLMDLTDPERLFYTLLKTKGYTETVLRDAPGIGFVRLFAVSDSFASIPVR